MSETPRKRKLEEIIDLNDGFCQTPPSAKKARKRYSLEYKLQMVEASKKLWISLIRKDLQTSKHL